MKETGKVILASCKESDVHLCFRSLFCQLQVFCLELDDL